MKSSSNLTRGVFRAILSNRPYLVPGCQIQSPQLPRVRVANGPKSIIQRRHLFGFLKGSTPKPFDGAKSTPGNVELALSKLVDLVRARRSQSRLPKDEEVVDAFKFIFSSRLEKPRNLTRNEIFLASEAFQYLLERDLVRNNGGEISISQKDLYDILLSLVAATGGSKFRSDVKAFSTAIFNAIRHSSEDGVNVVNEIPPQFVVTYINVLAKSGSAEEALELLRQAQLDNTELPTVWISVLKGLVGEGRIQEFWKALDEMQQSTGLLNSTSHDELTTTFADMGSVENTKAMFERPLYVGEVPTTQGLVNVLEFCIRNKEWTWGTPIFDQLISRPDHAKFADTILLWSSLQDSSLKNIQTQFEKLVASGAPEMIMLNRLLQDAYTRQDSEATAKYLALVKQHDLRLDGTTYAVQLLHQLDKGDLSAAADIFEHLVVEDVPTNGLDVSVLNKYIATLSFSPNPEYELLMRIVDRVLERGGELDAEATAGLCFILLRKNELEEATSLLRHRVDSYPLSDRAKVAAIFRQFIIDPSVKDQRAFNAYEIFRHAFPETKIEDRASIMTSFFNRNRPDLACLVFGHMRQQQDLRVRPTADTYSECFQGVAKCRDIDGLQMVYNMLKLDLEVEQTTRVHNALIEAYTACQSPFTAIIDHFWKILDSQEGPTLSSFCLALRACEIWIPQGSLEARRIMATMQEWNLIITKEIYDCYIGAIAGQSEFENTVELIENMEKDIGESPDAFTIGTFYNAIPWQYRKDEVEKWAKQAYPDLWEELVSYGDEVDEEWEVRFFNIDRSIDVNDDLIFGQGEYHPQLSRQTQELLDMPDH